MNETFKDIVGYEGLYRISNQGRLFSVKTGKFIGAPGQSGYIQATLCKGGYNKLYRVHQLVMEAFVGPRPKGAVIRHLDDNPLNNNLINLCYGTYRQNYEDAKRNGHLPLVGNMGQLTAEQARQIATDTLPLKELVAKYGVPYGTIHRIKSGVCYSAVTGIAKHRLKPIRDFSKTEIQRICKTHIGQQDLAKELRISKGVIQRIRRTQKRIADLNITSFNDPTLRTDPVLSSTIYARYVKYFVS